MAGLDLVRAHRCDRRCGMVCIQALIHGGDTVTITFDDAYGMKAGGTDVTLHGVKIGTVSNVTLAADGRHVEVQATIDRTRKDDLRSGTRFYVRGAQPDFSDLSSIKALVSGPEIVLEPGPGQPVRRFIGSNHRPALTPTHEPIVSYVVRFPGPVGGLKSGADVELRGFHVGTVTSVQLHYNAARGVLSMPVQIALDPKQLGIAGATPPADGNWKPLIDGMLEHLIAEGLRARLSQDPPLVGPREVKLDFVRNASSATLASENGMSIIPSIESADIDDMTSKADQIITRINGLPIKETGDRVLEIATRVDSLVHSPAHPRQPRAYRSFRDANRSHARTGHPANRPARGKTAGDGERCRRGNHLRKPRDGRRRHEPERSAERPARTLGCRALDPGAGRLSGPAPGSAHCAESKGKNDEMS